MCLGHTKSLTPRGCPRFAGFVWSVSPDAFLGPHTGQVFAVDYSSRQLESSEQSLLERRALTEALAGILNSKS